MKCSLLVVKFNTRLISHFLLLVFFQPPIPRSDEPDDGSVKAIVDESGYISLHLQHGMTVLIAPNQV
jgi:hypothetical protein